MTHQIIIINKHNYEEEINKLSSTNSIDVPLIISPSKIHNIKNVNAIIIDSSVTEKFLNDERINNIAIKNLLTETAPKLSIILLDFINYHANEMETLEIYSNIRAHKKEIKDIFSKMTNLKNLFISKESTSSYTYFYVISSIPHKLNIIKNDIDSKFEHIKLFLTQIIPGICCFTMSSVVLLFMYDNILNNPTTEEKSTTSEILTIALLTTLTLISSISCFFALKGIGSSCFLSATNYLLKNKSHSFNHEPSIHNIEEGEQQNNPDIKTTKYVDLIASRSEGSLSEVSA